MAFRRWPNKGYPPRDPTVPLGIEWANGTISRHTFTAHQLVWRLRGDAHDIAYFWRTNGADDVEGERV